MEKSLLELELEITCCVCQEHYTQPKLLPCFHYYCKQCILTLALRRGTDEPFPCPECRKEVILPEGSVEQLPTAFFINRLKAACASLEQAHGKVEVKCETCSESGAMAEAFCRQCSVFICSKCVESHQRLKMFEGHKVASFDELREGRAQDIVMQEPLIKTCPVHKQPLVLYCYDCEALICRDCPVKGHKDHNFEFSAVAAPKIKEKLMEELEPVREVKISLMHAVEEVQTTKRELDAQCSSVANIVKTSFQDMHAILEKHEQELLDEVGMKLREKTSNLSLQEENLSTASVAVQSVLDYTEECVRLPADNDVLSAQAEIRRLIKREIEEHNTTGRSLYPVEEVDVGVEVKCADALEVLCQTSAKLTQLFVDPAKCLIIGSGSQTAQVLHTAEISLVTKLSNNKTTKISTNVYSQLTSLWNGSIKCDIDKRGTGEYLIRYTPTVHGRHELTVAVNGKQVVGSPFTVSVSLPPTKLGKPIRVWASISRPTAIAVNSAGEMIVAECQGGIALFDKEGNKLRSIQLSEVLFCSLAGVAFDDEDNVYLVAYDSDTLFKLCKKSGIVKGKMVRKRSTGAGHRCVAAVGQEVLVCECLNTGTVMVYDRELEYVRQIVGRNMGEFCGISPDLHGNLYIIDYSSCIQVFSCAGDFLRSFSCDVSTVKKLSRPHSVCVAGQYVYVTDCSHHNVSVFTTEGEYVTSFGERGCEEGDLYGPRGVCTKYGFVYVCDTLNDRVQVF